MFYSSISVRKEGKKGLITESSEGVSRSEFVLEQAAEDIELNLSVFLTHLLQAVKYNNYNLAS